MNALTKKLKKTGGFTLSEVLVAVMILVMISATALPAALNAYKNAVDAANGQVLFSTAVNALRSELSTAWDVTASEKTISYKSSATGSSCEISIGTPSGEGQETILLKEYMTESGVGWLNEELKPEVVSPLVSKAMRRTTRSSGEYMTVVYDTAALSDDGKYVSIGGLTVKRGDNVLAEMPAGTNLLIRIMTKSDSPVEGDSP